MGREDKSTSVEQDIARQLLRIHEESYGASAATAHALVGEDAVVVFLDGLELQRSEEFLVGAGEGQAVIDVRGRYQQAIETTFRAAVERATGRRVISFVSATKLDPNYVVEIFRLEPRSDSTHAAGSESAEAEDGSADEPE